MDPRTVILYRSKHHGNTKKLVDALVAAHPEIDTIDVATLGKEEYPDLSPITSSSSAPVFITPSSTRMSCAYATTACATATT